MNRTRRRLLQIGPLLITGGWASGARADEDGWRTLTSGGCAVLLRHARTTPGIGDPPGFRLEDCSTQRNRSDAGRAQARRFGREFERRGIRVDEVRSSRWCRCLDTARLAFPRHGVEPLEALDSFFADGSSGRAQTIALRDYLSALPATHCAVLVTHMVNITALTGEVPAMGEALVVNTGGSGAGTVLGRIGWTERAQRPLIGAGEVSGRPSAEVRRTRKLALTSLSSGETRLPAGFVTGTW